MYNYPLPGAPVPTPDQDYNQMYRLAEKRVKAKIGFYSHLSSYVIVNGFLICVYLLTGPLPGNYSYPWFVWTMFGWGIGLFFHFLSVFVFASKGNSEAQRRRMIEEEMRRMGVHNSSEPNQYKFPPEKPQ
jgi:2TM domain